MTEQKHVIKRQIIEVKIDDAAEAQQLQAEISRIYHERIIPLIDRYCSELSTPDRLLRIDSLVIDLGTLDPEHLESDLMNKVGVQLRQALAEQLVEEESDSPRQGAATQSHLELFLYFVHTGTVPWWANASNQNLLRDNLQALLDQTPAALRRALQTFAWEDQLRLRIVHQYSDALLIDLASLLVPALRQALPAILSALLNISLADISTSQLRRSIWSNILHVGGIAGQDYATTAAFYQAVLKRVAIELGTNDDTLIAAIDPSLITDTLNISAWLDDLRAFVAQLPADIRAQWQKALADFEASLHSNAAMSQAARRVLDLFQGLSTETLPAWHSELKKLSQRAEPVPTTQLPHDLSFSEADEVYVQNAGLVILWPFLSNFFKHLDLLEGKAFKNSAAQQRAVGLLHHLASGQSVFPEYVLPLNKVLCGMDLTSLFDFDPPLLESEASECSLLLSGIIAQVPILRDMSVDAFRGTFLLRQGVLSERDGAWLLRVERQTYDIVLERFPWGWEWLKLPWMNLAMRVEWL